MHRPEVSQQHALETTLGLTGSRYVLIRLCGSCSTDRCPVVLNAETLAHRGRRAPASYSAVAEDTVGDKHVRAPAVPPEVDESTNHQRVNICEKAGCLPSPLGRHFFERTVTLNRLRNKDLVISGHSLL